MAKSQEEMEAEFLRLCRHSGSFSPLGKAEKFTAAPEDMVVPEEAVKMLQAWSDKWLRLALRVASSLKERLFTELTKDIEKEYKFHGA
jgi:hypothetical protein